MTLPNVDTEYLPHFQRDLIEKNELFCFYGGMHEPETYQYPDGTEKMRCQYCFEILDKQTIHPQAWKQPLGWSSNGSGDH